MRSDGKDPFLVHRSQKDMLFDHLTKFVSRQQQFIIQIKLLIKEGIARCSSYSTGVQEKIVIFEISDQRVKCEFKLK